VLRRSRAAVRSCCPLDVASRAVGAPIAPSVARLTVVGVPLAADHADAQGRWFWYRRSSADQSLLMSFSAANEASASDAKSSGVTTLRTLSPPTHSPIRTLGIMATRQCPGLRRYVTIENSETFAMMRLGLSPATVRCQRSVAQITRDELAATGWPTYRSAPQAPQLSLRTAPRYARRTLARCDPWLESRGHGIPPRGREPQSSWASGAIIMAMFSVISLLKTTDPRDSSTFSKT
jgi:hypothetical protein